MKITEIFVASKNQEGYMWWNKPFIIINLIAALWIFSGCTTATPVMDRTWGDSYEAQKFNQIMNPESKENLEPVTGLNGRVAAGSLKTYEEQAIKGAEEREKEPVRTLSIGTGG
jgi:hypothetical protein